MKLITILTTLLLSTGTLAADVSADKPVERGTVDFGNIPHNSSRTQIFTLTNNSENPLTDIFLKIRGDFYMKHNCPATLNTGESCRAKISLWVTREGGHSGRLTIRTSAKDYIYDLYGYGERDPFPPIHPPILNPPRP